MAEGHESRVEARITERGGVWGGVSPPQGLGCGNLVQSGAFWQEIHGSPVIYVCERKHCHTVLLDSGIDIVTCYFDFLVVRMSSVSYCSRRLACSGRVSQSSKQALSVPDGHRPRKVLKSGGSLPLPSLPFTPLPPLP